MEEDNLNYEQKKAIELEVEGKKELAEMNLKIGREKKGKEIVEQVLEDEKKKEEYLKDKKMKEVSKIREEQIKEEKRKENRLYEIKMEVISLIAKKQRRLATELIVEYIKEDNFIYSTRDDQKSEIWFYKEGIYVPQGKSFIMEHCRKILNENYTAQIYNEVIQKIEADTFIDVDEFFKTNYVEEVPVKNGILNIFELTLSPFTPKKIFFNKLDIEYNPEAKCPHIKKFFSDVLKEEEDAKVIFELFGYCLLKEYRFEKTFMFVGNGRNGKSKTLSLLKKFLGIDNCCSVPLSQITPASTSVCELYGRLANLAGDLSNTDLKDTGTIKQVTGRDLINAKRKFLRDLIFVNYAKLIFACNNLPRVYDMSDGFWDRWVLLEFPYKFIAKEEYFNLSEVDQKKCKIKDENIIDKISTELEMSGLLNEAIKSLHRLIRNHEFSYTKGSKEIKDFWVRQSDSFMAFCFDHLEENVDGYVTKKELRRFFSRYCKLHKIKGASDKAIKATLENEFGAIESQKSNEDRDRIWEGIILNNLDNLL